MEEVLKLFRKKTGGEVENPPPPNRERVKVLTLFKVTLHLYIGVSNLQRHFKQIYKSQ